MHHPEVIDRACAPKSVRRTFPSKKTKEQQSRKHTTLPRAILHGMEGRRGWRTSVTTQEKYNHSNPTSASVTKREEGGDGVTPDTLVYTFDYSRSRGLGGTNLRRNKEGVAPSAAIPPASARRAAAVDTKQPTLAERNHPRAVTILQSLNGSNIDKRGSRFLVWQATVTQPSNE